MADKSRIAWCEATWNPATGCTKLSAGCKFCYAKHQAWPRLAAIPTSIYYGREFEDVRTHPERLDQPLRWRRPRMIFVNSMSDLFHESIPDEFIEEVFAVMALAHNHIFQVLTKRPERMREFLSTEHRWVTIEGRAQRMYNDRTGEDPGLWLSVKLPLPNVWLGVSVENQETADERVPILLNTEATVRWLSCEPLLDRVDLEAWLDWDCTGDLLNGPCEFHAGIDWVVVGGESGVNARPMPDGAATLLLEQCREHEVPFFFKQGSQANWPDYKDFDSVPSTLRVREYPN